MCAPKCHPRCHGLCLHFSQEQVCRYVFGEPLKFLARGRNEGGSFPGLQPFTLLVQVEIHKDRHIRVFLDDCEILLLTRQRVEMMLAVIGHISRNLWFTDRSNGEMVSVWLIS